MSAIKILMVEDEIQMFNLMKMLMTPLGFEVAHSFSAADIPARLRAEAANVLITDFLMPGRNGLEVARAVRAEADFKTLPVFLLTSKGFQHRETVEIGQLGLHYMRKPVLPQILSAKVKAALGNQEGPRG